MSQRHWLKQPNQHLHDQNGHDSHVGAAALAAAWQCWSGRGTHLKRSSDKHTITINLGGERWFVELICIVTRWVRDTSHAHGEVGEDPLQATIAANSLRVGLTRTALGGQRQLPLLSINGDYMSMHVISGGEKKQREKIYTFAQGSAASCSHL